MHKEKPLIEIRTSALVEGINELHFTCLASDFEDRHFAIADFSGEIEVCVVVQKSDEEIAVAISTSAVADVTCDRCLALLSRALDGSLDLLYTFSTTLEGELSGVEEHRQIAKSSEYIDITGDVRDALILSRPMKVICRDNPDCRLYESSKGRGEISGYQESEPGETSAWQKSLEKLKTNIVN
ncbi:MAG: DUF177 domain-containing protein [Chlorobium sp.]|nr:MAG: DUF177 domain-containing protein [Chlorobium sp.]